ncbi:MAG: HU family DNA-binding protein [Peptostreptococcaceae bacterium]|jgi:nucleoid DNA-binding protein|nr:HU family DNA-binding protein [Peptostreptococcaceae bacterium]
MKKQEFVLEITNIVKENGSNVSQETVRKVLAAVEEVIGQVVANQDEVVVAGMKISTREQAAKSGVTALKGGIEWSTPAMIVPTVKFLKSKKTELSVEI